MYFTKEDFQQIEAWFKVHAWKDTDFTVISPDVMGENDIIAVVHDGTNCAIPYIDLIGDIIGRVNPATIVSVPTYNDLPSPGEEGNLYIVSATGDLYNYEEGIYKRLGFPASKAGLGLAIDSNGKLNMNLQSSSDRGASFYTINVKDRDTDQYVLRLTVPAANTVQAGVMTSADKQRLDNAVNKLSGIANNANNYVLKYNNTYSDPHEEVDVYSIASSDSIQWHYGEDGWEAQLKAATRDIIGGLKIYGSFSPPTSGYKDFPLALGANNYTTLRDMGITRIPMATSLVDGLMSKKDKAKLDNISTSDIGSFYYKEINEGEQGAEPYTFTLMDSVTNSDSIAWHQGVDGWEAYIKNSYVPNLPQATSTILGGIKIPYSPGSTPVTISGVDYYGYHGLGLRADNNVLSILYDPTYLAIGQGGWFLTFSGSTQTYLKYAKERIPIIAGNLIDVTVTGGQVQGGTGYTTFEYNYYNTDDSAVMLPAIEAGNMKCKINISALNIAGYPTTFEGYLYKDGNNNISMVLSEFSIIKGSPVLATFTFDSLYSNITAVTITGL